MNSHVTVKYHGYIRDIYLDTAYDLAMEPFRELLLSVWREACRHIDIAESTAAVSELLTPLLPVNLLIVRRFDPAHRLMETVGMGGSAVTGEVPAERQTMSESRARAFVAWVRSGRLQRHSGESDRLPIPWALPAGASEEALAGPLTSEHGTMGVVILAGAGMNRLNSKQQQAVTMLLEPLSAALENHVRLHELSALRAAAEADRRSLLQRLGRDEIVEDIVGAEGGLRGVMERVDLVAPSDAPVLLLGETGSGKEVVARAVHARSPRSGGPFVRVNCGAIPPELIDSELFGHERGAFTGASATRRGWFERADEGTLLLDEIGDLPPAAQVRLLRILQEGTFERVGGEETLHADVRIISATHRDLPALVQAGKFREDLWYRIAVFPIVIPPLREHRDDIPGLAAYFIERAARRFGLHAPAVSPEQIALLQAYDWPGNVREFASVIDRAVILGDGETLDVRAALGEGRERTPGRTSVETSATSDVGTLDDAMRSHIVRALERTRGRIEGPDGAASLLAINPHTLRARMRKLGIDWAAYRPQ